MVRYPPGAKHDGAEDSFSSLFSPLPYHTANGKTVPAVNVTLGVDTRRVRTQEVTVRSRTSSSRPPETIRDACADVAIRAIVVARTEKVEIKTSTVMVEVLTLGAITQLLPSERRLKNKNVNILIFSPPTENERSHFVA